ncbi:hypothetical protein BJX70DRAFT_403660 [Aspergillus crustosus]
MGRTDGVWKIGTLLARARGYLQTPATTIARSAQPPIVNHDQNTKPAASNHAQQHDQPRPDAFQNDPSGTPKHFTTPETIAAPGANTDRRIDASTQEVRNKATGTSKPIANHQNSDEVKADVAKLIERLNAIVNHPEARKPPQPSEPPVPTPSPQYAIGVKAEDGVGNETTIFKYPISKPDPASRPGRVSRKPPSNTAKLHDYKQSARVIRNSTVYRDQSRKRNIGSNAPASSTPDGSRGERLESSQDQAALRLQSKKDNDNKSRAESDSGVIERPAELLVSGKQLKNNNNSKSRAASDSGGIEHPAELPVLGKQSKNNNNSKSRAASDLEGNQHPVELPVSEKQSKNNNDSKSHAASDSGGIERLAKTPVSGYPDCRGRQAAREPGAQESSDSQYHIDTYLKLLLDSSRLPPDPKTFDGFKIDSSVIDDIRGHLQARRLHKHDSIKLEPRISGLFESATPNPGDSLETVHSKTMFLSEIVQRCGGLVEWTGHQKYNECSYFVDQMNTRGGTDEDVKLFQSWQNSGRPAIEHLIRDFDWERSVTPYKVTRRRRFRAAARVAAIDLLFEHQGTTMEHEKWCTEHLPDNMNTLIRSVAQLIHLYINFPTSKVEAFAVRRFLSQQRRSLLSTELKRAQLQSKIEHYTQVLNKYQRHLDETLSKE